MPAGETFLHTVKAPSRKVTAISKVFDFIKKRHFSSLGALDPLLGSQLSL